MRITTAIPAILILKPIADFARPTVAQNQQSTAVQACRRQACTAADFQNENCCRDPNRVDLV